MRLSRVPLVGVLLAALVVGPAVSSAAQSLEEARSERAAIQTRLDRAAEQLGQVEERVARLDTEAERLEAEAAELADDVAALQEGMQAQVVALFKRGSVRDPLTVFLTADDPNEALLRAQTLEQVIVADLAEVEALGADRQRLAVVEDRLADQRQEVADALEEQAALQASLERDLQRAAELEQRLEAEERERRRREAAERRAAEEAAAEAAASRSSSSSSASSSGSSSGPSSSDAARSGSGGGGSASVGSSGKACPVGQPHSFTDTWGAPRSGGRAHRGTDILAPYGTPVYAIVGGTWAIQRPGPSAGLWAILRGNDGNQYWYMHLQSHTVASGARVSAGQQVATNGDTGNARGTPHVHFELHPGGGSAVNPYPTLRAIC
ncbi:MAG: peptidoglycan DD-metalloendopeptidase family protein [Nitriliruptor sp.]